MSRFSQVRFLVSAASAAQFPADVGTEVGFVGRSNAGKSSAINAIAQRQGLARTSKTPGRTQLLNFFELAPEKRLVDLPGYGYARVPQALRSQWRELVGAYLRSAHTLLGVVLLMDARHPLTPLDQQLIDWLGDMRLLVLLTKADKLSRSAQQEVLAQVRQRLRRHAVTLFSSVTRQGVEECRDLLAEWLRAGGENKKPPVKGI